MSWALIDDKILTHPKMQRAEAIDGDAAWTLWSKALVYVRLHHLHGVVPGDMLALFVKHRSPSKIAATLVKVGLWEVDGENFKIHDYHHINDTPEQVEAKRQEARERMQKRRGVRANKSEQHANNGEHGGGSREAAEGVRECSPPVRDPEPNRTEPIQTDPNRSVKAEAERAAARLSDSEQAVLDALGQWPALEPLAGVDMVRQIRATASPAGWSPDDVLTGIAELGEKQGLSGALSGQADPAALAKTLAGYIRSAHLRRRAGGANAPGRPSPPSAQAPEPSAPSRPLPVPPRPDEIAPDDHPARLAFFEAIARGGTA